VKDFSGFTKEVAVVDGKPMGLPYFSAIWVWNYYETMLEKLKIDKPFSTYEEFIEHCVKAKKDGVSRYPVLWVAGVGLEQLPGTWYSIVANKGGKFFDKDGKHMLGAGSIAREVLKWWANTFEKGLDISDPESLKLQFTTSATAFGAGNNLYRGPNHHYGLNVVNDPAQSPIAGKVKVHGFPGDGRTIGVTHVYFLNSATRDKEWAWKLLQYLGGKTRTASTPRRSAAKGRHAGLRLQLGDELDAVKKAGPRAGRNFRDVGEGDLHRRVCTGLPAWHFPDRPAQHRGQCLTGQITADQCCDSLIRASTTPAQGWKAGRPGAPALGIGREAGPVPPALSAGSPSS
jgi:hypothetical protein